jgi:GAF domain-containing protein
MSPFQAIVAQLLLETGGSRAVLQLGLPNGKFPIVAEAVAHGAGQIRDHVAENDVHDAATLGYLDREREILVQNDLEHADPPASRALIDVHGARAQMLAPLIQDGRLAGIISVQHALGAREWNARDLDALRKAESAVLALLDERGRQHVPATSDNLRGAAVQAILDSLRETLGVQRCTLRQNVSAAYAFPVTYESRDQSVRRLLGDFTIVQSGQPVIEKLLAERAQVVQNDSRVASPDPLFHTMLAHYGGMRAQIVTPLFRDDSLAGVVSIHYLIAPRAWTREETDFAREATRMIGLLFGATLS